VLALRAIQTSATKSKIEPSFEGHTATVNAIAFSDDGYQAASASDDRTIRFWHIPSGRALGTLNSPAEVYAVAFSTDGKYLISAGRDRLVRLWDLKKREQMRVFKGHTDSVRAVAFSRDGKYAVSGGDDRTVRVWDLTGQKESVDMVGHSNAITSVAWSRDGSKILSGSRDGTVRWWDVQKHQILTLEGHAGPVLCVALSPDAKWALSGGNDKTVRLWSLPQKKELHSFTGHPNAIVHVQFDPSGKEFMSASSQQRIQQEPTFRRWDAVGRKEMGTLKAGPEDIFSCAAFSPDGRHVLVGGPGGFLRLRHW
jgi:WD40 repeat protein